MSIPEIGIDWSNYHDYKYFDYFYPEDPDDDQDDDPPLLEDDDDG